MECADTDICLQRIVTILERKDTQLLVCVITLSIICLFIFYFFIHHIVKTCSVTLYCRKVWSADANRLVEDAEEAVA